MISRIIKPLLLTLAFFAVSFGAWAKPVDAVLFTSPYCPHCRHLKQDGFPQAFKEKHQDKVRLTEYDLTQDANNVIFSQTLEAYHLDNAGIPMLIVGETVLQGYPTQIGPGADAAVQKAIDNNEETRVPGLQKEEAHSLQTHETLFSQITLWAIIGAGLADGVNPCAFAVIVFFVSFLAAYKYTKKEIVIVGSAYCAAVFLAYVLMGLGAFHVLYAMKAFRYVTLAVQWGMVGLCGVFLLLSIYDFVVYQRTKKSEKMLLQLPTNYKVYIHKVMRFFLKDKHSSMWRLLLAAFIVGFVVSGVEAVCTGQVYLPTIVVILKEVNQHFWRATEFLLLYNLMFILPLVLVFVLTLCGKESATFNDWLKKHLGLTKFILCCVFLGLLILLLATMF
ncbi:hypothetical protein [Candidatus Avelusimicrobium fimicolum]|jgi:hypothetical protein|uniref:hypothetical protein n=1 Tax=Candidatus Avelusimicrobium fimicolum TaxID=3416216 RepID=UPI003D129D23